MDRSLNMQNSIIIERRNSITISGVDNLCDFDSEHVNLVLCGSKMCIEGENLHISQLSLEKTDLHIDGKLTALYFYDDTAVKDNKSLISRLFSR